MLKFFPAEAFGDFLLNYSLAALAFASFAFGFCVLETAFARQTVVRQV